MIIGSRIICFDTLTSTNSHAIGLLASDKPAEGTIIQAAFQTSGKGQPGNTWESESGKNLLFSIILYPDNIKPENQFLVSMIISTGMRDYLDNKISGVSIKWPNDIYVNNDKIAGILLESSIMGNRVMYMVAGIGLNVNQERFSGSAPNPVSMKMITGKEYSTEAVLRELADSLDRSYSLFRSGKFNKIIKEYTSGLFRFGEWSSFRDSNGEFTGRILSVDTCGRMTVEKRKNGKMKYYFKEIEFIL